jgi:WD repeat-containing protein 23
VCRFLPNKYKKVQYYHHKVFCGQYSKKGDIFLSACQDQYVRLYDTQDKKFELMKTIRARDVGWSVLDVAFRSVPMLFG